MSSTAPPPPSSSPPDPATAPPGSAPLALSCERVAGASFVLIQTGDEAPHRVTEAEWLQAPERVLSALTGGAADAVDFEHQLELVPLPKHYQRHPLTGVGYQCLQCGESCQAGYGVGAVPSTTPLSEADAVAVPGPGGIERHLRHHEGACSQLGPNGLCAIHAAHGLLAKPTACIEFPVQQVLVEGDLRLSLQWECTRLHLTHQTGPALEWPLPLAAGQFTPAAPSVVRLGLGHIRPLAHYLQLEALLLRRAETHPDTVALCLPWAVASLFAQPSADNTHSTAEFTDSFLFDSAQDLPRLDALLLETDGLRQRLHDRAASLLPAAQWLHPGDRRRVSVQWLLTVLDAVTELDGALPAMELPSLWSSWLRSRLFGLGMLKAPSLFCGAVDVSLRYVLARVGADVPMPARWEGSPGDRENRSLVTVEHQLRPERMGPALLAQQEMLEGWLEQLVESDGLE